jgi:hypothetical protein
MMLRFKSTPVFSLARLISRAARSALSARVAVTGVALLSCVFPVSVSAQTKDKAARVEAPDGSPQLPRETVVSDKSVDPKTETGAASVNGGANSVIQSEERVQGRLASARVGVGAAPSYLIVDPNAGKTDRAANSGTRRVTPSQWELFRF